jgi:hypothetical protein
LSVARSDPSSLAGCPAGALRAVNDYFERRLTAVPEIRAYLDELAARS